MNQAPPQTVVVTTKNTASLTLGITALVVGVLSLLVGWIPFLGLLAIPVAVIGLLLAGIGIIIAMIKGFRGIGMPLLGAVICIFGFVVPLLSTGGTSAAISKSLQETSNRTSVIRNSQVNETTGEKTAYIRDHIVLYDVEAKQMDSILDGKIPGVLFKIRNTGERQLDMVEVTVYFKDADGGVISEELFRPVSVSDFSFSDSKPLKPGYVWQMEKGKFYAAKSAPAEWKEGSVDTKITDIRFSK